MTELLSKAFHEASTLPEADQDAIAARLLAEIENERRWDQLFAADPALLEQIAEEAHQDYLTGHTELMDPTNPKELLKRWGSKSRERNMLCHYQMSLGLHMAPVYGMQIGTLAYLL